MNKNCVDDYAFLWYAECPYISKICLTFSGHIGNSNILIIYGMQLANLMCVIPNKENLSL